MCFLRRKVSGGYGFRRCCSDGEERKEGVVVVAGKCATCLDNSLYMVAEVLGPDWLGKGRLGHLWSGGFPSVVARFEIPKTLQLRLKGV